MNDVYMKERNELYDVVCVSRKIQVRLLDGGGQLSGELIVMSFHVTMEVP